MLIFAVAMLAPSGESHAQTRTSQNQKRLQGDQAKSNRKKVRETRQKVRSRKGDRAFRGDITGRRIQSKSTPSRRSASIRRTASQSPRYSQPPRRWSNQGIARTSPSTSVSKPWRGDITGRRLRTRSASSVRRSPVFRSGPSYLSQKPYSETRSARRASRLQSTPRTASSLREHPWKGGRKIVARTPYGAYGYSRKIPDRSPGRGEKAFKGDITGRRVAVKRSPPRTVTTYRTDPKYSRRKPGDQPYVGRAAGDHRTATRRGEAGWQGDITGRRLRQNYTSGRTRRGDQAGAPIGRRTQLSASGRITRTFQRSLPQKSPGVGTQQATRFQGQFRKHELKPSFGADVGKHTGSIKARRPQTGGGSISAKIWGRQQGRLPQKSRGAGTQQATRFQGQFRRHELNPSYGADVGKYTGSIKARRPQTGGGSISAQIWGKQQGRLPQKSQGIGTKQATQYKGFHRMHDLKPSYGADVGKYSGSIKARRAPKGGGSISAKIWGKPGTALPKKSPGNEALSATQFRGNIKRGELVRGIAKDVGTYQGNLKARRVRPPGKFEGSEHRGSHYSFELKPGMEGDAPYYRGDRKQPRYVKRPNADPGALKGIGIGKADRQMGKFQGNSRLQVNIKMNPNSDKGALAGRAPNRSALKAAQYQGNMKMKKTQDGRMYPSYHYMANRPVNAKNEKEKFFSFRLLWVKLFKNTSEDPDHLKEPERRPRYDKRESSIWYD